MSVKRFCDVCSREIPHSVTASRVKGDAVLRNNGTQKTVNVEVISGVGIAKWNIGDLCGHCLFDALDRLDPREKAEQA